MTRTAPACIKYILPFLLFFFTKSSFAQQEANNWYFGNLIGLNFSTGAPVVTTSSAMLAKAGCASISDKNGNLLFYSNGIVVYDRTNQYMLNGTGLYGYQDCTQTVTIVPQPGNDSIYYVFTLDQGARIHGLCYSIINMQHNGGLGEVVVKNIQLITPACEQLAIMKHCNGKDAWVVVHQYGSDAYYAYLVTSAGISNAATPVISTTGNIIGFNGSYDIGSVGILRGSPDGKKMASTHAYQYDFIELMDFDNATGILSNPQKLDTKPVLTPPRFANNTGVYGVEFSPNSKLLYSSSNYIGADSNVVYQFDITQPTAAAIQNSRTLIFGLNHSTPPVRSYQPESMQLGPDKKIYVVCSSSPYLSVINNPNLIGSACDYQHAGIVLDNQPFPLRSAVHGLPAFFPSYFYDPITISGACQSLTIVFSIGNTNGISSVKWDFGDPPSGTNNYSNSLTSTHTYATPGDYTAQLIVLKTNGCINDTMFKTFHAGPFNASLGNDTSICTGDSLILKATSSGAINTWSNGANGGTLTVKQAGKYWLTEKQGSCTASDTILVGILQLPVFSLGKDTTICQSQLLTLTAPLAYPNAFYSWSTGVTTQAINVGSAGKYWLELKDQYGCKNRDTIAVNIQPLPVFYLGQDTTICKGNILVLAATLPNSSYNWNTGSTGNSIQVSQPGIYWLDATQNTCTARDSINVTVNIPPVVSIGNDTTLCENTALILDAGNSGATYLWNNKSLSQQFPVSKEGIYWVKVTSNGCSSADTISISYNKLPVFTLGPDQLICEGISITLDPRYYNASYLWQDGSAGSSYTATKEGVYYVNVTNTCGSTSDTITIRKGLCKIKVPNAFTPNNDGANDIFKVSGTESITGFHLQVYDRFGLLIFDTKNKYEGWNGSYKGQAEPSGTYVYIVEYRDRDEKTSNILKGSFILIR